MDSDSAQESVRVYWDTRPCDSQLSDRDRSSQAYFLDIERQRYGLQPHIPGILSMIDWRGKRVLEIGTGVGTDARSIISRGGRYTGINVDRGSTDATLRALRVFSLPGIVLERNATALDFPDDSFDVVYSFGVLHHIPEAEKAVAEIHRVLKPGGKLLVMIYNRSSINYVVEIMFIRKLALRLLSLPGAIALFQWMGLPREKLERHAQLQRERGRMTDQEWVSRNTDGPDNPYSRVYDAAQAAELLRAFRINVNEVFFFDYRHWGILGSSLPRAAIKELGRLWGWHRVVCAEKAVTAASPRQPAGVRWPNPLARDGKQ
jgi:SAM-dependent methyltransferase